MAIATVIIATLIAIYAYFKELRSERSGKILLCFLSALLMIHMFLPIRLITFAPKIFGIFNYLLLFGYFLTLFSMNVLIFDVWFKFR